MPWLLVFVCLLQATPTQAPARDISPPQPGTAIIRGRITDKESGQPIPGAAISLRFGRETRSASTNAMSLRTPPLRSSNDVAITAIDSLRTCYPDSTTESSAVPIVVRQADVDGLEIRMVRGLTFSISGVVTDSRGLPPDRAILELRHWTATGSGSTARSLPPDGRFTLAGLLPGDYVVAAETGGLENTGERRNEEAAEARVHVEGEDVDGLTLAMAPIITVRGRLIFDDGRKPRALGSGFMVRAVGAGMADVEGGVPYTIVQPDLTFELTRILGPSTITMTNVPTDWTVQSVRYRGNDITDNPTTFTSGGDSMPLEITLSRRGGLLAGSVLDEAGAPAVRARVVLFPADADKWRNVPAGRVSRCRAATHARPKSKPQRTDGNGEALVISENKNVLR